MKKKTAALAAAAVVIAACAGGYYFYERNAELSADTLTLRGNVDIRQVSLAFEVDGRVTSVRAEEGDTVKKGDVLATLDTVTRELEANQVRANIEAALSEEERAKLNEARVAKLWKTAGHAVSREQYETAQNALRVATANVKASQAQLAIIEHDIKLCALVSPTDGIIRSRLLEPGDMASTSRPVFTIATSSPKWIRVYVNEKDLGRVKPGLKAEVTTDTGPKAPVAGTVGFISSTAEFTPKTVQTDDLRTNLVYEMRVIVDDPDGRLRLGQPATVRVSFK